VRALAALPAVTLAALSCYFLYTGADAVVAKAAYVLQNFPGYTAKCQALIAHVPPSERDDVLGYRVEPKWYVASGIVPARRIFFMQEILGQVDPALMDEVAAMFRDDPPTWLALTRTREDNTYPIDSRVLAVIETRYELVAQSDWNDLLRLQLPTAAGAPAQP
jgi:hypothetical protein